MAGIGSVEMLALVGLVAGFIINIFFLLTLSKALRGCAYENRRMRPGLVWLSLIPVFSFIWNFFVVLRVDASLEAEFEARGIAGEFASTRVWGLAYSILTICVLLPVIGTILSIGLVVCWIVYWVKVAGLSRKLVPLPQWAPVGAGE